jgi:hypothetical protein
MVRELNSKVALVDPATRAFNSRRPTGSANRDKDHERTMSLDREVSLAPTEKNAMGNTIDPCGGKQTIIYADDILEHTGIEDDQKVKYTSHAEIQKYIKSKNRKLDSIR